MRRCRPILWCCVPKCEEISLDGVFTSGKALDLCVRIICFKDIRKTITRIKKRPEFSAFSDTIAIIRPSNEEAFVIVEYELCYIKEFISEQALNEWLTQRYDSIR